MNWTTHELTTPWTLLPCQRARVPTEEEIFDWIEDVDSWGQGGDLPFAGDFDRDGFIDDVAVFRPSTHVAYYDYDHNGTTDEESTHFTTETGIPVAGDFDSDGYVDDVVFFLPDWEPTSIWFYDYDHNGPANDVSEWGWEDGLPLAGAFGGDQDP